MKLYEFEGKQLLQEAGIAIPKSKLITSSQEIQDNNLAVIKAQTMSGGRGKAGFVKIAQDQNEAKQLVATMLQQSFKGEPVKKILLEEKVQIKNEYYLSILYNTTTRKPVIILSKDGGVEIENNENKVIQEIDILEEFTLESAHALAQQAQLEPVGECAHVIKKVYDFFMKKDMKLLEINPIILTQENKLVAADAVIILDDDAFFRQEHQFPQRIGTGREKTQREIKANEISNSDHKGIAGKTFIDLDGDIGILASGGGASITSVDALLSYGAKPANYTEYSGNPSAEKVEALTRLVLDIPNLNGLFVVGAKANFTNIKVTIEAILKVIKEKQIRYPIVFRRDGPFADEAKQMVEAAKQEGFDIEWYGQETAITLAAKRIAEKVEEYKKKNGNTH